MIDAFHLGGFVMWPTLFFGMLLMGAAIRYAIDPAQRFIPLLLSLGMITFIAGGLGFVTGVAKSLLFIGNVSPDRRWIAMLGVGESLMNLVLAFVLMLLASLVASVGAYRLSRVRPEAIR
ncbi:MAG: hypothetical protein NVS3B20_04560 [Polyangiales bacterium]